MNTTTTAGRLRHAMTIRGLDPDMRGSKNAITRAAKLSSGYINQLLDEGHDLGLKLATRIGDILRVDGRWIAFGSGMTPTADPEFTEKVARDVRGSKAVASTERSASESDRASTLGRIIVACERLDDRQLATLEKAANRLVAESGSVQ